MWALFGAVGVLLMIACANVSGLMLTVSRFGSHDDAIRVARRRQRALRSAVSGRLNRVG